MTTTIIYSCGHSARVETEKPLTEKQRQDMKEELCPLCRVFTAENIFGYGGDIKPGGVQ